MKPLTICLCLAVLAGCGDFKQKIDAQQEQIETLTKDRDAWQRFAESNEKAELPEVIIVSTYKKGFDPDKAYRYPLSDSEAAQALWNYVKATRHQDSFIRECGDKIAWRIESHRNGTVILRVHDLESQESPHHEQ